MIYVDTSVLVALIVNEPQSAAVAPLHMACAEQVGAMSMATLDNVMARNAQRLKIKPVPFN